ncbi:MAG: hypothetical protein CEN91_139 [Candidatus Berkelbacteria bacterium Licking1014_85]|uniref:SpoVT-AbrB domain-containing protein n=1 Tax=Candidatus Berkelbacteria bacterium Licking1014_85 TaxID=2017148 RepID=A0A554LLG1_9BACT|nr:MAG: hypothetical protein CEN91_139 [Candidatus Berkelbacteria bacterium Licking1014_85]
MKKTKRKLIKFSNYSFCITLPKSAVDTMGWKKGDIVNVLFDDKTKKITVSKTKEATVATKSKSSSKGDLKDVPELRW